MTSNRLRQATLSSADRRGTQSGKSTHGRDDFAARLGFTERVPDKVLRESGTHLPEKPVGSDKPQGHVLGRAVLKSQYLVRDLSQTFPRFEVTHTGERLFVPLMKLPHRPWPSSKAEGIASGTKKQLPTARYHLEKVPIDKATWYTEEGTDVHVVHVRFVEPDDPDDTELGWTSQLDAELQAVHRVARTSEPMPRPEAIMIGVAPTAPLAAEVATYLRQNDHFSAGSITLTGLQVCQVGE